MSKKGFDADLTIVDLNGKKTVLNKNIQSKAGWSAFHETTLRGSVLMTCVNGQVAFREGDLESSAVGKELVFKK